MAKRDFYEVLGVARDADDAALKSAYRRLAMKYHPDRNPDDPTAEQNFKEVNEAYDVLKDSQKRAAYDRFGHDAFENGGGPARAPDSVGSAAVSRISSTRFLANSWAGAASAKAAAAAICVSI